MSAITRARRLVPGRQAATAPDAPLRTGSLRTRTVLAVLALLTVLLVALSLTVQAILGAQLRQQIQDRLADRASAAAALVGVLDDDALAERLSAQGVAVQITSPDGGAVSVRPGRDPLGATLPGPDPLGTPPGSATTATPTTGGDAVTVASSAVSSSDGSLTLRSDLSDGTVLELSAGTGSVDGTLASLRGILAVASVGFLLLAAVALVVVVRRTLQPLEDMTGVARSIGRGDRGRRLRPTRPATELGRTATAFDGMLDDLEHAEHQALAAEARMRAFVADAAHELRTPVAGIRASADALVRTDPSAEERERLAVHVVREAIRAGRLVDDMLMMARLDEGLSVDGRPVRVPPVVEAAVAQQQARTPGTRVVADVRGLLRRCARIPTGSRRSSTTSCRTRPATPRPRCASRPRAPTTDPCASRSPTTAPASPTPTASGSSTASCASTTAATASTAARASACPSPARSPAPRAATSCACPR
ncbi:hypothetical protein MAFF212519_09270 [Clavibacter michiganensis]